MNPDTLPTPTNWPLSIAAAVAGLFMLWYGLRHWPNNDDR